jgi:zinc transport system permease protein
MDATLGVLSHSALAIGLVAISFVPTVRVDLSAYLFGDILAVSRAICGDLGGAALVLGLLAWRWSALLTATLNEELAFSSGIRPERERLVLTLALAVVVALAIKVVGALLIAAMLIIPAAAARSFARTPEAMAAVAVGLGLLAVWAGLQASLRPTRRPGRRSWPRRRCSMRCRSRRGLRSAATDHFVRMSLPARVMRRS